MTHYENARMYEFIKLISALTKQGFQFCRQGNELLFHPHEAKRLAGFGSTPDEAWRDAVEATNLDQDPTPLNWEDISDHDEPYPRHLGR